MKKIGYDQLHLDALKVVDDKKKCCLRVNAVITKVGVYPYPDGRAFKSRMELIKATPTARNAKITIMDHPDSMVVMSQKQIYGTVEKPFFERDRIRATLNFDKYVTPTKFLTDVRAGNLKDVSIGFYYQPDFTPGTWENQPYDYVMRDIVIDHVAAGVAKGRCSYPACGIGIDAIGVDALMRTITYQLDIVGKRGNEWCVFHCHPDGTRGGVIKCFPTKAEAEAMHRAILAHKHGSQDKPPKDWWDNCIRKAEKFASDPAKFCGDIWHNKPELRASYGGSSVQFKGGKKGLSEDKDAGTTTQSEYDECVAARIAEGWDEGAAKDYCTAYTTPSDKPAVPPSTKPEETGTTGGAQEQHAPEKPEGPKETSEVFAKCVRERMAEGATREEAEKVCRGTEEHKGDQEVEKTELERCIENKVDEGMSAEEAREWCLAEQSGEHAPAADMFERSQKLLAMREHVQIERQRSARRHPL